MYNTLKKFLDLRYRLLPYIYSLAGWTTHRSYTMLRALPFDFRDDPATYNCSDQFMFGPAFLVNPVTQPMYYTVGSKPITDVARTRPVYLPAGTDWYDFWTGQRLSGGQIVAAQAALDTMPLYVRAGSIIPMGPRRQYVDDQPDAPIEIHVYTGNDGSFLLYEDEGDNYSYEHGAYSTIQMSWKDETRRLTLEKRSGQYPGMPAQQEFHIVLHNEETSTGRAATRQIIYTGETVEIGF
jgi:alpha-D-xyloside xylohydrolase